MNFLPFLIARRFYLKKNKNSAMLFISVLSITGICISIFALIMSFSALNGFEKLLNNTITSTFPHGIIKFTNQSSLFWKDVIKKIRPLSDINYSEPYIVLNGLLEKNKKVQFVEIKSFQNLKLLQQKFLLKYDHLSLSKKNNSPYELFISYDMSKFFSVQQGDSINIIILDQTYSTNNYHIKCFPFKITSIFKTNSILNSNIIFLPLNFFQKFLSNQYQINAIELNMFNPFDAKNIIINAAKKINQPLLLYTWIDTYKNLYHDIQKNKIIVYLTLFLLIIISCFNITSISLMTISKKTKEIAILRTIGASNFLIQLIFLYHGLRFIIIGSFVGICISTIIIYNFENIILFLESTLGTDILSNNIYYKKFLLLELKLSDVIIILISTIIIGIITNWYPAYCASKITPREILKEY